MKKIFLLYILLGYGFIAQAQIIQGTTLSVENDIQKISGYSYKGYIEAGLGVNLISPKIIYEITTTHGIEIQNMYLGLGTGLTTHLQNACDRLLAIPLYANIRYFFNNNRPWQIFVEMKTGYDISLNESFRAYPDKRNIHYRLSGLYLSPGVGMEYKRVVLSLNYMVRGLRKKISHVDQSNILKNTEYDNSSLLFHIGIHF